MHFTANLLLLSAQEATAPSAGGDNPLVALAILVGFGCVFFLALYGIMRRVIEPHRRELADYNRNATSHMEQVDRHAYNLRLHMQREEEILTRIADTVEKLSSPPDVPRQPPTEPATPADAS